MNRICLSLIGPLMAAAPLVGSSVEAEVLVGIEAVRIAGSFKTEALAAVLHSHKFETMLGRIGFDEKGDVTGYKPWIWWVWKNRQVVPVDPDELPPNG
jgi:ABC-type branched-subunit amino acid transport system substrate-binding protein